MQVGSQSQAYGASDQVFNKRHFYGNKRNIMVNNWNRLQSQFLTSEGSQLKKILEVQLEASSDGMRAGSDNQIHFSGLKFEYLC